VAQSWFIIRGESRLGPFTHHGLVTLAANGGLTPQDMVWSVDLPAPIPAMGVAGLFPEPEPEPIPETRPASPVRPPPRPSRATPPEAEFALPSPRKDRFAALFEDGGDTAIDEEVAEEEDDRPEPSIPVVRRPSRRATPARRKGDNSGLLIGLGGLSLLAVIVLIIVLEQGETRPSRPSPAARPPAPVVRQVPPPTPPQAPARPPAAQPERPARPPRYDKQPLIDEMTKATVDSIYQANTSVKARYRELWESQLQTLLAQETKGMREEEEIRATVKRICDSWAAETQKFVAGESAPPPPPDALDGAAQAAPDGEAPMATEGPPGEPEPQPDPAADTE